MWIRYNNREMVNLERVTTLTVESVRTGSSEWKYGVLVGMIRIALLPDALRAEAILETIQAAICSGDRFLDLRELCRELSSEREIKASAGVVAAKDEVANATA